MQDDEILLMLSERDGELFVDSRLIADQLGIAHKNFLATVEKYQTRIESEFGVLAFETEKPLEGTTGGRPARFVFLSETQALFLMTLSKNTTPVVDQKIKLVQVLNKAKKLITQQKLQLEQQNQQALIAQNRELLKILQEQAEQISELSYRVSYQATQTVELWKALTAGDKTYRLTPYRTEADKLAMAEKVKAILHSGQRRLTLATIAEQLNQPIDSIAAAYVELEASSQKLLSEFN